MELKENYPLKPLNTFGLDAKARFFASIQNADEAKQIIESDLLKNNDYYILGGGSNVLFTRDFDGVILKLKGGDISATKLSGDEVLVKADGGVDWNELIRYCLARNYAGLENLTLIPGNVGAAPIQNIGAYGVEQEQVFHELTAVDLSTAEIKKFNHEECRFNYRDSIFKNELKGKYLITSVVYKLSLKHQPNLIYAPLKEAFRDKKLKDIDIRKISETVAAIRRSKLPDPEITGNAGSFFKNPVVEEDVFLKIHEKYPNVPGYEQADKKTKLPAAWLIEQCGWKGKRVGDAGVHEKQALVIVNYGNASGREILDLSMKISADVKNKFGVILQPEVNVI